ncbi:uncharacterized protein LOC128211368 [Mya arenaria]|uniref:uncharacterized protein LOC128211368 n=1 Tax=Mya arenaria TaxID=6604 RepID=UPI0022E15E9F|nr:uncharacterized protein LOC128211368 [Mya arenaria]
MNKEEQKRLRETMPDWSRVVDPMTLTIDLPCLSETDKQRIRNSQIGVVHGCNGLAAGSLYSALIQKKQGFREFVLALRRQDHESQADNLDPGHDIKEEDASSNLAAISPPDIPVGASGGTYSTPILCTNDEQEKHLRNGNLMSRNETVPKAYMKSKKIVIDNSPYSADKTTTPNIGSLGHAENKHNRNMSNTLIANLFAEDSDSDNNAKAINNETDVCQKKMSNLGPSDRNVSHLKPDEIRLNLNIDAYENVDSKEETFRKQVVNDSIEVVSCNIGKVHTRQAREKHICEEHVDHSFEDRRNSVPRHLDGDDELDSIREKGKNKRWPGIDASCETKNSAFDDQDSVSWSSQSDSTSTQFGNKLTESLDNVLSPYSEQPRGVTGQGEDESFTNDCQNTRGDVTEVKEKDLPLNNEQPVNVIEQSVNECPIIGDDAAQSEENVLPPDFDQSRYLTRQRKDERLTNNRSSTGVEETQTESNIVPTNNDQSRDLTGPRVDEQLTNNLSITGIEASQAESNTVSSKEDQSGEVNVCVGKAKKQSNSLNRYVSHAVSAFSYVREHVI